MSKTMMYLKGLAMAGLIAILVNFSFPSAFSAHFLGIDSVDNGEIRWGTAYGSTAWTGARNHSISTWNNLGSVYIAGDTWNTVEDLFFADVYRSDLAWSGHYFHYYTQEDRIEYNNFFFNGFDSAQRLHTANHELGHALGLGHHGISGNAMTSGFHYNTGLGTHDRYDYYQLW